ncbi:glycosyltransferase, activator-dependent family [Streptomyces sp. 2224.1]|uniref:activator-dependent family glycosyltransferase n=1 Tax=unclassified Streptomyces TaxID=2593676 RepID=UPI00088B8429|nr:MULTISPECIES: activator-dependent family glycosyltransferase [unclassified Streptomyces]PBC83942.1 glycosyltransferase (activator-dependent family) [Streptomyces sp. 2321.6]SDR36881.1 glycosyltransferase, activator-dependent family [Streptomyces sp. KS_16]SEB87787.1 glycosyltransferase, activator-dependent family [Streptomyces sp. 2224.1]SED14310.1 glycosyltransferase, activator-dependent family [Streptomyces sp. 2133.1]SNC70020.1 glycosyltransferase, activator-dependent family [Streptomyce
MRVLFAANPHKSIFQYMVPLAWALRTAGHEVRFASQPSFAPTITQAGLTAVPVGRDHAKLWAARATGNGFDQGRAGIEEPYDAFTEPEKDTWDYLATGMAHAVADRHRQAAFPMIADLVEFALHWKPDLVIWDPLTLAAPIAAKAVGAAHARLLFGIDIHGGVRRQFLRLKAQQPEGRRSDPLAQWLGGYARKYGGEFTEDMVTGHFTIDQFPGSLQTEACGLHYERMQFIPYGGPATVAKWLWKQPEKPRVALTMGLSATDVYSGYTIPTQEVLDSLADLDIELVATIADAEKAKLRRIPDNARLVPYVPLHHLAPTCSAFIHHAGAATLATVARHPVPHLSLHYHWDQPILARKLTEHGAGLALHTTEATGGAVRTAVQRLLGEPHFRSRATALRDETLALPTPNQLVPRLEELTARHRGTTA